MKAEECVALRPYNSPNWYSAKGVYEKRKRIEAKGLPDFSGWRFITLTLDPYDHRFSVDGEPCPLTAYLKGKKKMKYFMESMRGILGRKFKWCWKLEFQKNGWAHWHILLDSKLKMTGKQMCLMSDAWSFGRVNVKMVRSSGEFLYTFKYAFKPALTGEDCVPYWFANYTSTKSTKINYVISDEKKSELVDKPVSFGRVRFWQTSFGFYTKSKPSEALSKDPPVSCMIPYALSVTIDMDRRKVQVIAFRDTGEYRKSQVVLLKRELYDYEFEFIESSLVGTVAPLGVKMYLLPIKLLKNKTYKLCQILQIAKQNQINPREAFKRQGLHPVLNPF